MFYKYLNYISSGSLSIKNLDNNSTTKEIKEKSKILYSVTLSDRNLIMYFTYDQNNIYIKTYDIDKDLKTDHQSFKADGVIDISDVKFSTFTNCIYVNTLGYGQKTTSKTTYQEGKGNVTQNFSVVDKNTQINKVYRIDIHKEVSTFLNNAEIKKMELLNHQDVIVYQNKSNNIFIKQKQWMVIVVDT